MSILQLSARVNVACVCFWCGGKYVFGAGESLGMVSSNLMSAISNFSEGQMFSLSKDGIFV